MAALVRNYYCSEVVCQMDFQLASDIKRYGNDGSKKFKYNEYM